VKRIFLTLLVGLTGAVAAYWIKLPAAALIGSSLAVSLAAFCGKSMHIPLFLRNTAFAVIGISLGSGITTEALAQATRWPVSLMILSVSVLITMIVCGWILSYFFSYSAETSLLSTSPGALSYALSLCLEDLDDGRTVVVLQSIRLLLVTTLLPFILQQINGGTPETSANSTIYLANSSFIIILFLSLAGGLGLNYLKVPAAYLFAGMVISGLIHLTPLVQGRPSALFLFPGFVITGSLVGSRFADIPMQDIRQLLSAAISNVAVSGAIALFFSSLVASLVGMPFGQVLVAFAPGGVEAMSAIALSLGYDPAFVATHHLFRIIFIIAILPILIKVCKQCPV